MPSDAKAKRAAQKKARMLNKAKNADSPAGSNTGSGPSSLNGDSAPSTPMMSANNSTNDLAALNTKMGDLDLMSEHRAVTGTLSSHPDARDIHIDSMSITFHGAELLVDSRCELNNGRRYGLIGVNGCGKSSLLSVLGNREVPIPEHIDIFHLKREMPPSDKTALECVMEVDEMRVRLEHEAEELAMRGGDDEEAHDRLMELYERLDELDADLALVRAGQILDGLGFSKSMQHTAVKHFSGGWRMRISLARALFIKPALLLLDEPTNHLDLEACVWLEHELKNYKRILILISHSQDFLNGVCTNIIFMDKKKLTYFGGNYDQYVQTRFELEENQQKRYKKEQDQIAHMKNYIARFGHGSAKLARQAQSKEKVLKKMVDGGLTEKVSSDKFLYELSSLAGRCSGSTKPSKRKLPILDTTFEIQYALNTLCWKTLSFYFFECGTIPPPVIMVQNVSFQYAPEKPFIYKNLDFGFDLETRLALVGPNGAGKSTLLKLICGELHPTEGLIRRNSHLKMGRYHQHLTEKLDMDLSALEYMMKEFPEVKERDEMRKIIGRYGLTGQQQVCPIKNLSDGQRCRVAFAWLAWTNPHMLLLDEPTNHLDIETIDSLAMAINNFDGGLILVSHDFRLISQVAEEIWVCENQTCTKWDGDIFTYKDSLVAHCEKQIAKAAKQAAKAGR